MHEPKKRPGAANLQHLTWDDLRLFCAVASSGSMRRAATDLGLNGSTISRRLTQLERSLATRLLERHPEGVKLTRAGEEVQEAALAMHEQIRGLQRRVGGRDERLTGVVRISAAELLGPLLCSSLPAFTEQHPGLTLELSVTDAMAALDREAADVALRVAQDPGEQLLGRRVGDSALGIYASRAYLAKHGQDVSAPQQAWIAWPRAVEHKPAFAWLRSNFPEQRHVARASSASGVLQAVRADVGLAVLACAQVVNDEQLVQLRQLPASCSTPVWVLTHPGNRQAARVRAVADYLYKYLCGAKWQLEGVRLETPRASQIKP
jgi:DNA-binding transcriptional LysR family regulator